MQDAIVIIPTFNEIENIEAIIRAVFAQQKMFHILVVDDNSPDGTGDKVKFLQKEFFEQLWYYLVDNELLYNKEEKQSLRFLADAPFISGLPNESPGRAGQWLGYQIVKKYMAKFPQTTLPQLFQINEGKEILIKSKYKPA
jgi:glycosyltransferase involved in cell wall biosynthesis